jgi:hypothetical protein
VQSGTGRAPIIYTGRPFWDANVNTGAFSSLPLWIAAYGPTCPNLPASWSDWAIFQYSSTGSIPSAISGNVDLDRFNGTMADLTAFANGAAPTQAPPPPASSWNCANSASGGVQYWTCDGGALYRCDSTGAQQRMTCANGCTVNPVGTDDACSNPVTVPTWNCANSSYMGRQFWTCSMGTLYRCDASGAVQMMGCSSGCTSNPPGTDDTCNTPAWNCANSSYMGMQYWTCSGGAIHRCDASGAPQVVDCPSGCNSNPVGTDDACNPVLDGGTDGAVPDASGPDVQGDAPALSDVAHADAPGETTMAGPDAGGESERGVQSGCGCRVPRGGRAPVPLAALFVAMALAAERRRSVPRGTRRPAN